MSTWWAGRKVAVVGATGFIGSHLTEHLVRAGASVLAVAHTRRRAGNLNAVAGHCSFALADMLQRDSITPALAAFGPEVVFHLAAEADRDESFAHMTGSIESNAIGTANVLEAAARAGTAVFVYADSCKVYGNGPVPYRAAQPDAPVCSYAVGKAAGWRLCLLTQQVTGMSVCSLRSTFIYGPRQNPNLITHVEDCVRRNAPVQLLGGSQTRDLLYVGDAVRAFAAIAATPPAYGCAIPIGGGRELSVIQICREIIRHLGGGVEVIAGAHKPRLTEIWRSYCDNAEAAEMLGWSPKVGLSGGLALTLAPDVTDCSAPKNSIEAPGLPG